MNTPTGIVRSGGLDETANFSDLGSAFCIVYHGRAARADKAARLRNCRNRCDKCRGFAREYLPAASKVIAEAGGKFLLRGGRSVTLEGAPPKRLSIVEFETFEQAKAMFDSDPYRAASEIGHKYATFRITVVEGLPQ